MLHLYEKCKGKVHRYLSRLVKVCVFFYILVKRTKNGVPVSIGTVPGASSSVGVCFSQD